MIEAVVQTGAFQTPYRRAGSGDAVLLIGMEASAGEWLFDQIAGRFRTLAPVLPPELGGGPGDGAAPDRFELWLRGLIDGLGLERPALVAGASYGATLLRFATLDPHRVDRLALVGYEAGGPDPEAALEDVARVALHPVLLIRIPGADDAEGRRAAADRLLAFLAAPAQRA